jgi:hypothetical protein
MSDNLGMGEPDALSSLELISLYINEYHSLDAARRSSFEAAFKERHLPLPRIPDPPPAPARKSAIDRKCFMSYMFLIYSGTAIFYSWIYLADRLAKMDFRENAKHKAIQSGIALVYVVAEILLICWLSGRD